MIHVLINVLATPLLGENEGVREQLRPQLIVEPGAGPHVEDICLEVTSKVLCNALGGSNTSVARATPADFSETPG